MQARRAHGQQRYPCHLAGRQASPKAPPLPPMAQLAPVLLIR